MRTAVVLAAILLVPARGFGAQGEGSSGALLARLPVGARSEAMGGNHGTLLQSAEAFLVNPAAVLLADKAVLESSYHQAAGMDYGGILYVQPFGGSFALGFGVEALSAGTIEAWDYFGNISEALLQEDRLGTLAAAVKMGFVDIGGSVKYYESVLVEREKARALFFDAGAVVKLDLSAKLQRWRSGSPAWLILSASVCNMGNTIDYVSSGDSAPLSTRFGISFTRDYLSRQRVAFAGAVVVRRSTAKPEAYCGGEYSWLGPVELSLRAGFKARQGMGAVCSGIGLRYRAVAFHYAYVTGDPVLGGSHHGAVEFTPADIWRGDEDDWTSPLPPRP